MHGGRATGQADWGQVYELTQDVGLSASKSDISLRENRIV